MFPDVTTIIGPVGLLLSGASEGSKGFLDSLPDPMRPYWGQLLFVMILVTALYLFLKAFFFKPMIRVMDDRDEAIQSGAAKRAEAAGLVEARQADYGAKLRELRAKAAEHRKALSTEAQREKQAILDRARQEATQKRSSALVELKAAQASAKTDLMAQVEALSETMVQHLLERA